MRENNSIDNSTIEQQDLNDSIESIDSLEQNDTFESKYNNFNKTSGRFKKKLEKVSEYIIDQNNKLSSKYKKFKDSELEWNKKVYCGCYCRDWIWDCCSDCFKNCACFCCCLKSKKKEELTKEQLDEIKKYQKSIDERLREIENIGEKKKISDDSTNQKNNLWLLTLIYLCSILHFFALSEIHGILLALLKEIERTFKQLYKEHYDFKNNIIKTFHYFLTDSNFHDSSQINFNYATSFLTLYIIKSSKKKYIIEYIYIFSIIAISLACLSLMSIDYLTEEQLKNNENYSKSKLAFCFIGLYLVIYISAGLISLLPNKILDDYFKKEGVSNLVWKLLFINLDIGISVTAKNFFNYYFLIDSNMKISKIILYETIVFFLLSSAYCCFLFSTKYFSEKEMKENDKEKNKKIGNNESNKTDNIKGKEDKTDYKTIKDNNESNITNNEIIKKDNKINIKNDESNKIENKTGKKENTTNNNKGNSVNYIGGNIFIKTDLIYSFITIRGFGKYILSILSNDKIIFILLINFFSRSQKLKLKTEYKSKIKNVNFLFINFMGSFLGYLIIYLVIWGIIKVISCFGSCCSKEKENNNQKNIKDDKLISKEEKDKNNKVINNGEDNKTLEILILCSLGIVFSFIGIESILFYFNFNNIINKDNLYKTLIYFSIALTGSANFLLYDFYSCQKIEYISLSGVVSLAQLIFRGIEFLWSFDKNWHYILQFAFSICGLILTVVFIIVFIIKEMKIWWIL